MADNTTLNPGVGGDGIRTEQIGLVKYPVSKIVLGAPGADDGDVSAANPMPVTGIGSFSVNVGLTNAELRASAVPVSGPLTDAEMRASPIDVSLVGYPVIWGENGNGAATFAQRVTIANDSTGTLATVGQVTNLVQMNGQAIAMGTGARSAGTQRVTIATDDVVPASQSGTWTVQIGNTPNSTPILVSQRPATSGGLSVSSFLSTAAVQVTAVKASPGQIYSLSFFNKGASAVYLRLYNMTTTPGTGDTPVWRAIIPGNTAGAGLVKHFPNGLEFSAGIGFRCTGAIADNDATALAADEVTGNIEYK